MNSPTVIPLKRFVDPSRPITYGIVQAGEDAIDGVPYIRPVDMVEHAGIPEPGRLRKTAWEIAAAYTRSTVMSGDLVVSIGPSYGKTMVVPAALDGANLTQGTARVAPAQDVDRRYLRWALRSSIALGYWDAAVSGATFRALNLEPLGRTPVPGWDVKTQTRIADFLDVETARIDALIEKKRRMMALLHDRFTENARRMLTGGLHLLDPLDVRPQELMATSWNLVKVAWDMKTGSGTTPPAGDLAWYGDGVPWIVTANLRDGEITDDLHSVTREALSEFSALRLYSPPSLIIAMYGATIGRLGLTTVPATVNQACCVVHGGQRLRLRFLFYWLLVHRAVLVERALGAGQPNISQETIRAIRIAAPDVTVQDEIVERLRGDRATMAHGITLLRRQIELLAEHRQALITAAVTGQLDVTKAAA